MDMFFDGWSNIVQILITAPLIYLLVIAGTRLSGKRSTSQMNNFDWIVTVAIGSLVGSAVISESISIAEAVVGIGALFVLQYFLTLASRYSSRVEAVVKANPKLLFENGRFIERAMSDERITRNEVLAAIREAGHRRLDEVHFVILESDARFSVIARGKAELDGDLVAHVSREETRA